MECKKTQYTSEQFALDDIKRIGKKSTRDKVPTRAYLCNICNLWHLTSSVDWKESVRLKNLKITSLIEALNGLREEIKKLKAEIEILKKATNKEDRVAVKSDARVKELSEVSTKQKKIISTLRKDSSDLISKNVQLQKRLQENRQNTENE